MQSEVLFLKNIIIAIFLFLIYFDVFSQESSFVSTFPYRLSLKNHEVNVEFHFRQKSFPLVKRVIRILEEEGVALLDYFSYRPSSTLHILLEENMTLSNGSASLFPDNIITIITFPPLGSSSLLGQEDPLKSLVIHELAHIAHLDQAEGINRILGRIFGSMGKLMPSVVPRWFAEGVATWAESEFTQGGRQRLARVKWQLERALLDPYFCSNISCLDAPGAFPYSSTSYWMGADFITWIEEKKEGSVRCLVQENSDNMALFLNHAFEDCTGKSATVLFFDYLQERRRDIRSRQQRLRENFFVKDSLISLKINHPGPVDLERGAAISNGKLYTLWHRRRGGERVRVWDLERGTQVSHRTPFFVSSFLPPSGDLLPVTVRDNHLNRHRRRVVELNGHQTLIPRSVGADYAFSTGTGEWLYFSWKDDHWVIGEYLQKQGEQRILHSLPPWVSIKKPRLFQREGRSKLSFQVFDGNHESPYQLWIWYPGEKKATVLLKKDRAFSYWEQCEGVHLITDNKGSIELVQTSSLNQVVSKKIKVDWAQELAFMVWDVDHTVVFLKDDPEMAWHFPKGCREIIDELSKEVNSKSVVTAGEKPSSVEPQVFGVMKDYSPWSHMAPSWWLLGGNYHGGLWHASAETSLEDPKRFHQIGLKLRTPTDGSEFDFYGSYTHRFSDFREFYLSVGHYRSQNLAGRKTRTQETFVSVYEHFYPWWATWTPSLSLSEREDGELFYDATLSQNWAYHSSQTDDFFRGGNLDVSVSRSWRRGDFAYTGVGMGLNLHLKPWERLSAGVKFQYDKLFKSSYLHGDLLEGGGVGGRHSFYGLNYQDAFGHQIWTLTGRLNGEVARVYSSWGLLPLYFKEVRFLAGIECISADFIWLSRDQRLIGNPLEPLVSNHWGMRLELDIFYRNPGHWDFLWVNLHNPFGGKDERFISSFNFSF